MSSSPLRANAQTLALLHPTLQTPACQSPGLWMLGAGGGLQDPLPMDSAGCPYLLLHINPEALPMFGPQAGESSFSRPVTRIHKALSTA